MSLIAAYAQACLLKEIGRVPNTGLAFTHILTKKMGIQLEPIAEIELQTLDGIDLIMYIDFFINPNFSSALETIALTAPQTETTVCH